jgi:hypothetical protein
MHPQSLINSCLPCLQCSFPIAQHGHFCNLLRWYDFVHHTIDTRKLFPAAQFIKPKYVPPVPDPKPKAAAAPAAAPAAPAAAAGGSRADKKAMNAAAVPSGASSTVTEAPPAATSAEPAAAPPSNNKKEKKAKGTAAPATPAVSSEPAAGAGGAKKGDADVSVDMLDIRQATGELALMGSLLTLPHKPRAHRCAPESGHTQPQERNKAARVRAPTHSPSSVILPSGLGS